MKKLIIDISELSENQIENIIDEACQYGAKRNNIQRERYIEADDNTKRLIAAAPEMLQIIKEVQSMISEHQYKDGKILAGYTLAANVGLTDISCKITSLLCSLAPKEEEAK